MQLLRQLRRQGITRLTSIGCLNVGTEVNLAGSMTCRMRFDEKQSASSWIYLSNLGSCSAYPRAAFCNSVYQHHLGGKDNLHST